MAAICRLGFLKFNFFNGWAVEKPVLHHRTRFGKDQSNCSRNITVFVILKMAAVAILDFQKFEILTVGLL